MKISAIAGRNGSGKTLYVDQLRKQLASDKVRYIAFTDSYGVNVDGQYYLQLRWNQHDIDHETPTVGELLQRAYLLTGEDTAERRELQQHLYSLFHMDEFLDKYIITLSSGELRKFQLTKTLFSNPQLLIMDNPFIGLDAETRDQLRDLLKQLAEERDMEIMLVMSKTDDIPDYVTDIKYFSEPEEIPAHVLPKEKREAILSLPYTDNDYDCQHVIDMKKVTIRYGERTILKDLDWTVKNGERWALSGQNGSGKSTLLSLVCADKPEMHRSYKRNLPAIRIVASGLMDSIGLYAVPNAQDNDKCRWWLDMFGIGHLADKPFLQLSSGEQRLVLLARAFVKDPQLLILDEPLHGLDLWNRRLTKDIIETFCQRRGKTLIMVTHYQEELPNVITNNLYLKKQI